MSVLVSSPLIPILNLKGTGLNNGKLYVGVLGEDPQTNPQACFWDVDLTVPASQPVSVIGGYTYYLGSPAQLYTSTAATVGVFESDGTQVWIANTDPLSFSTFEVLPFEFLGGQAPGSNETMGLYVAERSLTFFPGFDGSGTGFAAPVAKCLGAPSLGAFTVTVNKNGSSVGSIIFAQSTGAPTFTSAGFTMAAGDYLSFVAQATVDSAFLNVAWTITAEAV